MECCMCRWISLACTPASRLWCACSSGPATDNDTTYVVSTQTRLIACGSMVRYIFCTPRGHPIFRPAGRKMTHNRRKSTTLPKAEMPTARDNDKYPSDHRGLERD